MDQIISKASSASASASSMASSLSSSLASAASSSSSSSQNLYSKRHLITSPTILLPVILKRLRRRHPFLLLSLSITIPFLSISLLILSLIFPSSSSSSSSSPSAKPPPSSSFLTFLSTLLRRSLRLTSSSSSYTDLHEEVILRIDADPDRRMAHISNLRRLNNAAVDAASTSSPSSPASPVLTPRFFSMNGAPRGSSGSLTSVGSTSLLSGKARSARSIVLTISIQNVILWNPSPDPTHPNFAFIENTLTPLQHLTSHPRFIIHLLAVTTSPAETRQILSLLHSSGLFRSGLDPRRVLFFSTDKDKCNAVVDLGSIVHVDSDDTCCLAVAGHVANVVRVKRGGSLHAMEVAAAAAAIGSRRNSISSTVLSPLPIEDSTSSPLSRPSSPPLTTSLSATSIPIPIPGTSSPANHAPPTPAEPLFTPYSSPPPQIKLKPLLASPPQTLRRRTSSISSLNTLVSPGASSAALGGISMSRTGSARSAASSSGTTVVAESEEEGVNVVRGGRLLKKGRGIPGNVRVVERFADAGLWD